MKESDQMVEKEQGYWVVKSDEVNWELSKQLYHHVYFLSDGISGELSAGSSHGCSIYGQYIVFWLITPTMIGPSSKPSSHCWSCYVFFFFFFFFPQGLIGTTYFLFSFQFLELIHFVHFFIDFPQSSTSSFAFGSCFYRDL